MEIKSELDKRISEIEKILEKYLPREEGYQKTIFEAMNYSVRAGGKRLRPMLMQETYRMLPRRTADLGNVRRTETIVYSEKSERLRLDRNLARHNL